MVRILGHFHRPNSTLLRRHFVELYLRRTDSPHPEAATTDELASIRNELSACRYWFRSKHFWRIVSCVNCIDSKSDKRQRTELTDIRNYCCQLDNKPPPNSHTECDVGNWLLTRPTFPLDGAAPGKPDNLRSECKFHCSDSESRSLRRGREFSITKTEDILTSENATHLCDFLLRPRKRLIEKIHKRAPRAKLRRRSFQDDGQRATNQQKLRQRSLWQQQFYWEVNVVLYTTTHIRRRLFVGLTDKHTVTAAMQKLRGGGGVGVELLNYKYVDI